MNPRITNAALRRALWAFLILTCLALGYSYQTQMLALPHLGRLLVPYDGDNWRRLVIVRAWLEGGSFFDHIIPHTNAPFGGVTTHWTRFLDLLLAAVAQFAPAAYTMNQKLMFAATWYPLLIALAAMACLNRAASRTKSAQHLLCLVLLALFSTVPGDYFAPGDSDHHGTLCTLWCGVLALMTRAPTPRRAAVIGLLLGLMTWISVEGLVLAALVYAILGVRALHDSKTAPALSAATLGCAAVAALALLIQQPHDALTHVVYDSISIVHVLLLSLSAAAALALQLIFPRLTTPYRRMAAAAGAGAAVLAVMAAAFPKFFLGPRADADDFITAKFLPHVYEALPLLAHPWQVAFSALWMPYLAATLLAVTWRAKMWQRDQWRRNSVAALLAVTMILPLTEYRWNYYLQPVAVMICAMLLPMICAKEGLPFGRLITRKFRPALTLWCVLGCVTVYTHMIKRDPPGAQQICSIKQEAALQGDFLQAHLGNKPLVLLADGNVAGFVQFFTPYAAIAGNYDREAAGLKDIADIKAAATPEAARALLARRGVQAMLACPAAMPKESWMSKLGNARTVPPWLKPLGVVAQPYKDDMPLLLFSVRPSAKGTGSKRPSGAG